jgi:phosphoribosylanthranilate isomerase
MRAIGVKVCGITRVADALGAAALGVTAVGLNFVADSLRYVTVAEAREICLALPPCVL